MYSQANPDKRKEPSPQNLSDCDNHRPDHSQQNLPSPSEKSGSEMQLLPDIFSKMSTHHRGNKVNPGSSASKSVTDEEQFDSIKPQIAYGDQDNAHIQKEKIKNKLQNTQFDTTTEYIHKLRFSIPLDNLYQVYDSCLYNSDSKFCPVLVKIGDKLLQDLQDEITHPYLLQVWTVSGKMIFERQLAEPLFEWNMQGNYLVFQESTLDNYNDSFYMLEMHETEECQIYNFDLLPQKNKAFANQRQVVDKSLQESTTGISNKFETGRIPYTIGIAKHHLLIRKEQRIYYVPLGKVKLGLKDPNIASLKYFTIHEDYRLREIVDIGENETALMLQNTTNKQLSFFQLCWFDQEDKYGKKVDVKLTKLGLNNSSKPEESESEDGGIEVEKCSDISSIRYFCGQVKGKFSQTACVLRVNGTFEFYSDFNLVSVERGRYCNKIATDNENYFMQTRVLNDNFQEERIEIYKVCIDWGNNIGMTVAERVFNSDLTEEKEYEKYQKYIRTKKRFKWTSFMKEVQQRSISRYFRLFTQFINYKTFMLVVHRQYITAFDLKNLESMSILLQFEDHIKMLAESRVDGNANTGKVMVLLNNNKILYIKEHAGVPIIDTNIQNKIPDKICKIFHDQVKNTATYMLTQNFRYTYQTMRGDDKNNFFRQKEPTSTDKGYKLIAISKNRKYEILPYSVEQLKKENKQYELSAETQFNCFQQEEEQEVTNTKIIISNPDESLIFGVHTEGGQIVVKHERTLDHLLQLDDKEDRVHKLISDEKGQVKRLPGQLIGVYSSFKEPETNKYRAKYIARITTEGIEVYGENGQLQEYYSNPNFREMILVDNTYVYCLCEDSKETVQKFDVRRRSKSCARGAQINAQEHGLYVYDIQRLLNEAQIESYLLAPAVVGLSTYIDYSDFSQRLSYQTSFEKISMMPFPHRNTINFIGMGNKEEYLIWREKGGFFTGLHKTGELRIWAVGSGKFIGSKRKTHIPEENCPNKARVQQLFDEFKIYKANEKDTCYQKGFQNFENQSLQLMIKKEADTILPSQQQRNNQESKESAFVNEAGHTVKTSTQDRNTYEFLVLKLTTPEDLNKDGSEKDLKVMIMFRFKFKLGDQWPTLHISKDTKRLMEVIDNKVAIIYQQDEDQKDEQKENVRFRKWKKQSQIHQYPSLLQGDITLPFLFNPHFTKYIDVDYSAAQIVVRSVGNSEKPIKIPNTLLGLSMNVENDRSETKKMQVLNEASVRSMAKRMHFVSKNLIRFINKEGIDLHYDIALKKVVCFTKWDNLLSEKNNDADCHMILDRSQIQFDDILTRLIRRCQEYKSAIEIEKFKLINKDLLPLKKSSRYRKPDLLSFVYKVNYQHAGPNGFMAEMSFTLLDWIICERIQRDPLFDFNDIDRYQQIELCFNIFPNNMTMLHKLACAADSNKVGKQEDTQQSIDQVVQTLFSICKKGLTEKHDVFRTGQPFEIPIIQDINGKTALDIAFATDDQIDKIGLYRRIGEVINIFFKVRKDNIFKQDKDRRTWFLQAFKRANAYWDKNVIQKKKAQMLNSQLAVIIFSNISSYGYLQHSQLLTDSIIKAIKIGLPGIGDYLDSRLQTSPLMPRPTQHDLKNKPLVYRHQEDQYEGADEVVGDPRWLAVNYNAIPMQVWDDKGIMEERLFKKQGVQKRMLMRYLDVPLLHLPSEDGFAFINALSDIKNGENLEIYSKRSIQILINSHWERQQWKLHALLFAPFLVMLTVYCIWSNFSLHPEESIEGEEWSLESNVYFRTILMTLAVFFLVIETIKIVQHPIEYVLEVWNWLGLPPLVMVLLNASSDIQTGQDSHTSQFWTIQSFTGLMMWMRCLYYLRGVEMVSYFIRMLIAVVNKIKIFMLVLAIVICGFADTFHSLSEVHQERYVTGYINSLQYSYSIVLGQFADDLGDQRGLNWFFFVIATIVSMLILANLLIEIVSETYGEVTQKKYLYVFKERCELICDVQTLSALVHQIYQFFRYIKASFLTLVHYCTWKQVTYQNKTLSTQRQKSILNKCELLIVAWEDPTHKESNAYQDEDGDGYNDNSNEEKLDKLCQRMKEISSQLGYDDDSEDEGRISVRDISHKLDRVMTALHPNKNDGKKDWQDHQCLDDVKVQVDSQYDILSHKQSSNHTGYGVDEEQRRRDKKEAKRAKKAKRDSQNY